MSNSRNASTPDGRRAIFAHYVRISIRRLGIVSLFLLPPACASPQLAGGVFHDHGTAFRIGVLTPDYHRLEVDGVDLAYRDDLAMSTIAVNARCGKDADDVPLSSLTQHLFLHFTEREIRDQKEFTLNGRAALRTELSAKLDGVLQHFVMVVLKKNGCVYDFMLIAHPDHPEPSASVFDQFVAGFQTVDKEP